jgi:PKD repeat protein
VPYPTGAPQPLSIAIRGFFPYQPPGLGPRLLVGEPFGYQVLDISNRSNPQSLGFEDYRISPTYPGPIPCGGDCHGSIGSSAVSADGGRAIFGLSALAAGSTTLQTMVGQPSANGWGFTLNGDMAPATPGDVLVQRVGSGYFAYTFADDGVRVADATTLPGLDPAAPNDLRASKAPSLPGGYQATLSGYWITYWDGSSIYLVNASSPLPATALTAQRFTRMDFGRSSDRLMSFSAAQDPANPAAAYVLGEFALGSSGSQHAGWTLIRVQGGAPTVVGSLQPGTGETFTYKNNLAADTAGNLFAFMWVRTPSGAYRQYTSPAPAFGATSASGSFDVTTTTTPGFILGRPAYVAGTVAGQIYAYVPGSITGWIVPMSCVSLNAPATPSLAVSSYGQTLVSGGAPVFMGDEVDITATVNPSPGIQPLTDWGYNFDFDFHAGNPVEDNVTSPRIKIFDNAAFGSPPAPPVTAIRLIGPCDPSVLGGVTPGSGAGCWSSVKSNSASGGPDFTGNELAGTVKPLMIAFEAKNQYGSGNLATFTVNWKIPAAKVPLTQVLSGQPLVSGSDGHPTATGFKWYFGDSATALIQASCTTSECVPTLDAKGQHYYWLTASYANGYVTPDYSGTTTLTYSVTDFAPAFAVNGSTTSASALIGQNITVSNTSQRGNGVTGAYFYNLCQIVAPQTSCPEGLYTVFPGMSDPPSTATFPAPGTTGNYLLRLRVDYTGGTTKWPDPSGVAGFPVTVMDVVPTIRIFTNGQNPCPPPWPCSGSFVAYVNDSLTAYSYVGSAQDAPRPGITWDFGGGSPTSGTGQGPAFSYGSPNTYTVLLHGYSTDPITATVVVTQHAPISVSAFANPSSTTVGANVSFSCSASGGSGSGYTYSWSGAVSGSSQSISRSFASPSTYTATCTVSDGQGSASGTASVTVMGGSSGNQQIWFNCSPGFSCPDRGSVSATTGMNITAYAYVNNAPDTTTPGLSWNAPDASPQSGSGRSFTLSYGNPGTYTLTLNGYGSPVTATVNVTGSPTGGSCPTFDFDIQHPAGTTVRGSSTQGAGGGGTSGFSASVGWTLWFTQNLGNAPSSWAWDFGDTGTANIQTPQHVFTKAGVYAVTFTIPSADGVSQCPKSHTITVTGPSGEFSPQYLGDSSPFAPSNVTPNKNVLFTALEPPSLIDTYLWDFGDGTPHGSDPTATHAFNPGSWTVTLTVTKGSASASTTLALTVPPPLEPPKWFVAGLAYTPGAASGTVWQSDMTILNPDPTLSATYSLAFLDGTNAVAPKDLVWKTITLGAQQIFSAPNVLGTYFGKSLGSWGAVIVRGDVAPVAPTITSRTYNNGDPGKGTFGLSVPAAQATSGVSQQSSAAQQLLIGLRDDASAYTNIGLVNLISADWSHAHLTFFDAAGANLGALNVDIPPYGVTQLNKPLTSSGWLNKPPQALHRVRVTVDQGGAIFPYATVIDQASTDPIVVTSTEVASNAYLIPGIVRSTGRNGEQWRSRVTVSNPSGAGARKVNMTYSFVSCDATSPFLCGNRTTYSADFNMNPGQTQSWDDFVKVWFTAKYGVVVDDTKNYAESLLVVSPASGDANTDPLVVLGETYNDTPNGHIGLQVPGYTPQDGASRTGAKKRLVLTGLASTAAYRTNLALFVVAGSAGKWCNVQAYSKEGTPLGDKIPVKIDPTVQIPLFGGLSGDLSSLSVVVDNIDDGVIVGGYATIIDNTSGAPTFVKAQPAP